MIKNSSAFGSARAFEGGSDAFADPILITTASNPQEASLGTSANLAVSVATVDLAPGDVAIVGYVIGQNNEPAEAATQSRIYFVLLDPVGSGTQIYFTDRAWVPTAGSTALNAGTFTTAGGDGTFTFTAASDLAAGTVIEITTAQLNAAGITLDDNGEAIYAYQGSSANAPTRFLFGLEIGDGNATVNASLANTGLQAGYSAVSVSYDAAGYVGPTTHAESFLWNGAASTLLHSITDSTNWVGADEGAGNTFNAADVEFQTGPWLKHADVEFWGTMGAGGLANTLSDSTHVGGTDDYNHTRQYEGLVNGTQVFWFARDIVFDTVDGKFFVVDSTNGENRILQGNIADLMANPTSVPALTVLVSDTGSALQDNYYAMDVDTVNNIVYFVHGSQVEKVNYNTANQTPTVLFRMNVDSVTSPSGVANPAGSTNNYINDMVINFASGKIYLSSTRVVSGASDQVQKNFLYELSGLTTSSGTDAFTFHASNTGTARLLPFAQNDDAYNPGGSAANSPATAANAPYFLAQEFGSLDGLAIDAVNNILYFSTGEILFDHDLNSGTPVQYVGGTIASYNLSGNPTGVHTVLYQQTAQFGGAIPGLMGDLEIDTLNGHLYVLDYAGINGVNDDNHWYRMNTTASTPIQFTQTIGDLDGSATVGLTLNHAPTLTGSGVSGLAVTEASSAPNSGQSAKVTLFTGITIADVDTTTADEITGAVVRIGNGFTYEASSTATGHTGTVDWLTINNLTSGTIAGSGITFTYNQTTGAMVLSGAATVAEYKTAIELVQFSTSGDNVTNDGTATTRTIHVSVSDGLTMSDEISATVTVTGINDAPVNTVGAAMNFIEDTTGSAGALPPVNAVTGISIGDADADSSSETFTVTLSVNTGTLTLRTDVSGGLAAGNVSGNGTATLILTGTQNQINATLAAVNASSQPNGLVYTAVANFNGAATLTIVTNDQGNNGNDPGNSGTGTTEADSDTKTLNVADVNDAPTIGGDGTEDSPTIVEDTPFTNLNAPTVAILFGGQFSDALDAQFNVGTNPTGSTGDTFAGIAIVANGSNANGNWQYWDGDSWENIGAVSLDAAKTFTAATLIRFNPALNFSGAAPTLSVRLIETGGSAIVNGGTVDLNPAPPTTGAGSVYSAGTVVLSQSVTAVNDAPVNNVGGPLNINEDSAAANLTGISIADVDANPATNLVTVTFDVDHGTLAILTNVAGGIVAGDIVSQDADTITVTATLNKINATLAAAGGLTYTVDVNYNGGDTLEVTTNDQGATGVDPGLTGTATSEEDIDSKTINIAAVNDEPAGVDTNDTVSEGDVLIFTASDFSTGMTDPLDGHSFAGVKITTLPTTGTLKLNGIAISAGASISLAQLTAGQLTFEPVAGSSGTSPTFTFQVQDNGGTANGGVDYDQSPNTFTINVVNDGEINGTPGDDTLIGTPDADMFDLNDGGNDNASGLGGNDGFYFGAAYTMSDIVNGGDGNDDQIGLQGNYSATLGSNISNVETLALLSGNDTRFGDTANNFYDYNITFTDAVVAAGAYFIVNMNGLRAGEDVTFNGSAETNGSFIFYGGFGVKNLTGGAGNDGFYFGPDRFASSDRVNGGGGTDNQLGLRGDYTIDFNSAGYATAVTNIQTIALLSDMDPNFTQIGDGEFDYTITLSDGLVGAGQLLTVSGGGLGASETMVVNGASETNGSLRLIGGASSDTLTGGAGNDMIFGGLGSEVLRGNGGADYFVYTDLVQSQPGTVDVIQDFTHNTDIVDLSAIDANSFVAGNNAFTFIGSAAFSGSGAASAGQLRAVQTDVPTNTWQVQGDVNGDGVADFLVQMTVVGANSVTSTDILL